MTFATLLLGIDEAGYGPRLGPLVIGAVQLAGPDALATGATAPAWALLHDGVVPAGQDDGERVVVGDSKAIHKPARGIRAIEEQALALVCAATGDIPATLGALWAAMGADWERDGPWAGDRTTRLPRQADPVRIRARAERLAGACGAAGVQLFAPRVRCVQPPEFNAGIRRHDNKSVALFEWVAPLLRAVWETPHADRRLAVLDKEGGRDRYLPLVSRTLRDARVVGGIAESRERSHYVIERAGTRATMLVEARGERHLPVAMASMVAKYVRELAMESWNDFWIAAIPGLRRTAGYPQDANRFLAEIEDVRCRAGIANEEIVRCR